MVSALDEDIHVYRLHTSFSPTLYFEALQSAFLDKQPRNTVIALVAVDKQNIPHIAGCKYRQCDHPKGRGVFSTGSRP